MIKYFYIFYSFFFHLYNLFILRLIIFFNTKNKISNSKNNKPINLNKIIIFGSSKSLLKIDNNEKKIILKFPKVFMNRNLIYWKKINIWPEYYFLLDTPMKSKVSGKIFVETLKTIEKNKKKTPPIFLLESFYKFLTPKIYKAFFFNFRKSSNLNWANNKNETLFGHHGSLTSLINILCILKFRKILILGVDLNTSGYFYNKKNTLSKFTDHQSNREEKRYKIHANLIKKNDKNILTYWNLINKSIRKKNISIYCGSKKSELIKKGFVRYMSIKNFNSLK